jgi:rod shape-determining protein MreC
MPAYTTDLGDSGGRRQWVVAVVLFFVSVSLAFLPTPRQQQVASVVRGTILRPFVVVQEGLSHARTRSADSEDLQRQLDSLVAVTTGHLTLADENRRLRSMLGLRERIGAGWITANVVRPGTSGSESMFMLDVGSDQGVQRYAPIVSGQGIVGVVQEVYPSSAIAMDWTHPDFRVSAMDANGIVYGIVRSRRGEFREEDRLEFDGTAFQARLEDGSPVVTSDLSGVWPRGVPIGKVDGLAQADAGWRKSYWLRPMVEVGSVTHVLVGVEPARDLYGVWPVDAMLSDAELAEQILAREDSVEMLRAVLAAPRPRRDSLVAALLLGGDDPFAATAQSPAPADSSAQAQAPGSPPGAGQAPPAQARVPSTGGATRPAPARGGSTPSGQPSGTPVRPDSGAPSRPDTAGTGTRFGPGGGRPAGPSPGAGGGARPR